MPKRALGKAVRVLRKKAGFTQKDLAAAAGMSRSNLSKLERGEDNPLYMSLWNLTQSMHASLRDLADEILNFLPAGPSERRFKMLPGDILLYAITASQLEPFNCGKFLEEMYTLAKDRGVRKILLDLTKTKCVFTDDEQFYETKKTVDWLKGKYWPDAIAVAANGSLKSIGADIARTQWNLNCQIFPGVREGLKWLRRRRKSKMA